VGGFSHLVVVLVEQIERQIMSAEHEKKEHPIWPKVIAVVIFVLFVLFFPPLWG